MTDFGIRLKNILTDRSYANWLKTTFSLDEGVVDDFAELMDKPEEAIRRFESVFPGKIVRYTAMDGSVEFSTAVAVQIAGLYGEHAPGFQSLIETVFASVFCEHEEAEGRYGNLLDHLPSLEEIEITERGESYGIVAIETIPLTLPIPGPKFSEVVNRVRSMPSCKALRTEMRRLELDPTFSRVEAAWRNVASDLADCIADNGRQSTPLQKVVIDTGKDTIAGIVSGGIISLPIHGVVSTMAGTPETVLSNAIGGAFFGTFLKWYLRSKQTEDLRLQYGLQLQNALKFTCVKKT